MAELIVKNNLHHTDIKVSDQKGCIPNGKVPHDSQSPPWTIPDSMLPDDLYITPVNSTFPDGCNACWNGNSYTPVNNRIVIPFDPPHTDNGNGNNVTVGVDQPC